MHTLFKPSNFLLFTVFLLVSLTAFAKDKASFDDQRPENISDKKWSSLRAVAQEAKLLPTPAGIGGEGSRFGQSISID